MKKIGLLSIFALFSGTQFQAAEISDLTVQQHNGQVFLQWQEKGVSADARLSVWSSEKPISKDAPGRKIAGLLNANSARDWWLDIDSFIVPRDKKLKDEEIFAGDVAGENDPRRKAVGFVIREGAKPIDPSGGLHVHTPGAGETGKRYFAVSLHRKFDDRILQLITIDEPIDVKPGKAMPICLKNPVIPAMSGKNKPLVINLHGRGGGVGIGPAGDARGTHLLFAPRQTAWREGIPFKFSVTVQSDRVVLTVFDRIWIGRRMSRKEISDSRDLVPAISTFWFGYNPDIARSIAGPEYKFDNYTERYLLYLIDWAKEYLGVDPNAVYVTGGSMGGSGAIQLVTHFPELFAAAVAQVPIYSYSWKKHPRIANSAFRMQCSVGKFSAKNPALMPDGTDLLVYGDGARNINRPAVDMPPLFATNGRNDASIPWANNPPFYRAANAARQAFTVFWNNGTHGMSGEAPADMKIAMEDIFKLYRLDKSFPAFANFSDNRNYGNGEQADGDLTGWINRGLRWENIVDQSDRYEITVTASHPEIRYPATVDITLRRRQKFLPAKGETVTVTVNGTSRQIKLDDNSLLTVEKVILKDAAPVKITLQK